MTDGHEEVDLIQIEILNDILTKLYGKTNDKIFKSIKNKLENENNILRITQYIKNLNDIIDEILCYKYQSSDTDGKKVMYDIGLYQSLLSEHPLMSKNNCRKISFSQSCVVFKNIFDVVRFTRESVDEDELKCCSIIKKIFWKIFRTELIEKITIHRKYKLAMLKLKTIEDIYKAKNKIAERKIKKVTSNEEVDIYKDIIITNHENIKVLIPSTSYGSKYTLKYDIFHNRNNMIKFIFEIINKLNYNCSVKVFHNNNINKYCIVHPLNVGKILEDIPHQNETRNISHVIDIDDYRLFCFENENKDMIISENWNIKSNVSLYQKTNLLVFSDCTQSIMGATIIFTHNDETFKSILMYDRDIVETNGNNIEKMLNYS